MESQNIDRISNLPVHLIEHILERLPLEDKVKTSVLSTKWRFLWTQLPFLGFDWDFYRLICQTKEKPLSDYMPIINSVLLQCRLNARDVYLFIPGEEEELESNDVNLFHNLIKHFLCDGLERLHVDAQGTWPMSRSIFFPAVMSFASRLTHLQLFSSEFSPPSSLSQVFPSLISVDLNLLETSAPEISHFLSSCPKLQEIKLLRFFNFHKQYLDIKAPELRHLHVEGNFKWLRLSSAEKIEVLIIDMYTLPDSWSDMGRDISDLFGGMTKLEKIRFGPQFYKIMAAHSHTLNLPIFDELKSLGFHWIELYDKGQVLYFWNFVTRCTNLTSLSLFCPDGGDATLNEICNEMECNHSFNYLLNLKFYIHECDNNLVLKLIEVLLGCSPTLERLSVEFAASDGQDVSKAIKEIMKICRASTKARVYIKDMYDN